MKSIIYLDQILIAGFLLKQQLRPKNLKEMILVYYYNLDYDVDHHKEPNEILNDTSLVLNIVSRFLHFQFHLYEGMEVRIFGNLLCDKNPLRLKANGNRKFSFLCKSKFY